MELPSKKIMLCIGGALGIVILIVTVVPIEVEKQMHAHPPYPTYYPGQFTPGGSQPAPNPGAQPLADSQGSSSSKLPYTGDLTFYSTGLGACGRTNTDNDNICAISHILYDASNNGGNPNNNPLCGRKIQATHKDSVSGQEKTLMLTVVDRCEACKEWDIDLSPEAFKRLEGDSGKGRVKVQWGWA